MFLEERQNRIFEFLKKRKRIEVNELTEILNISADTIRRDLNTMEKTGILTRTHGGAILSAQTGHYSHYNTRINIASNVKEKISEAAYQLIEENDTIFLQSSTTVAGLAGRLNNFRKLTVFTNSIPIAAEILTISETIIVNIIGGNISNITKSTTGPAAVSQLENISVDKVFIGACSISSEWGLSTPINEEVEFNRKLLEIGKEIFILADKNKLETKSTYKIADLNYNFTIITDESLSSDKIENFKLTVDTGLKFISTEK